MSIVVVKINGVDKTDYVKSETLNISDELNSRNTQSFQIIDPNRTYIPEVGQVVTITDPTETILYFAGTINSIAKQLDSSNKVLATDVECVDYNQLCDRFLVSAVYENKTCLEIITDIFTNSDACAIVGESVGLASVQVGPTITKAIFNFQTVAQCLDDLKDLCGYDWNLDYSKNLHFFERETYTAAFSLTANSENYRNLTIKNTREQYRNKQYIRAGFDVTDIRTESFIGDGTNRTFTVSFPVAKVPTVTVGGAPKSIGILELDTGKDWYWNKNSQTISQDDAGVVLTAGDTLAVTYQGFFPIIVTAEKAAEIADRIVVEGGTGLYENVEDDPNIDTQDLGIEKATGYLRRFGSIDDVITFETDYDLINDIPSAGEQLNVNLPQHNINATFIIGSVEISDVQAKLLRITVTAYGGEYLGGFMEYWRKLIRRGQTFVIRDNEVIMLLRTFTDNLVCGDTVSNAEVPPGWVVGTFMAGYCEVQ
jgi:hypothetical protein